MDTRFCSSYKSLCYFWIFWYVCLMQSCCHCCRNNRDAHFPRALHVFPGWFQAGGGEFWKSSRWPGAWGSSYVICLYTLHNSHILWQPNHLLDIWLSDSSPSLTLSLSGFQGDILKNSEQSSLTSPACWAPQITDTNGIMLATSRNRWGLCFLDIFTYIPCQ